MPDKKAKKREKSCGAIVYRGSGDELEILLLRHKNGGHWSFPKGHVEGDETEVETAYREILEETSISTEIDTGFRYATSYSPKRGVMKDVIYFAARASKDSVAVKQEEEIVDLRWMSMDEAVQNITFKNDSNMLEQFSIYISQKT